MATRPRLRKLALTAHIVCSVGWLGAVAVFLALAISAVTSQDPEVVRGVHLAMRSIGWLVLVPLSVASLLTGLLQSLSSKWGLLRHYWVLVKLALNILATAILLLYMQTLDTLGDIAAQSSGDDLSGLRDPSPRRRRRAAAARRPRGAPGSGGGGEHRPHAAAVERGGADPLIGLTCKNNR